MITEQYNIKQGDILSTLAEKIYGDGDLWQEKFRKRDGSKYSKEEAKNLQVGDVITYEVPEITHKELLTLSNLTNLEWYFADVEPIIEIDARTKKQKKTYKKINDLLKPQLFTKKDDDGNITEYRYGGDNTGKYFGDDVGLKEMRQKAGIAMEYLEKLENGTNTEGQFLEKWEVIYGADNYKIVQDFFDDLLDLQCEHDPDFIKLSDTEKEEELKKRRKEMYPSREKIEGKQIWIERFQIITDAINIGKYFIPLAIKLKFADKTMQFKGFNELDNIEEMSNTVIAAKYFKQIMDKYTCETSN